MRGLKVVPMESMRSIGDEQIPMESVHDLFVRVLQNVHSCWMRGLKVVPMESMGSIRHEQISMEIWIF